MSIKNIYNVNVTNDINFVIKISNLKNESLTLKKTKKNPKIKVGYQTFLLRSCYYLGIPIKFRINYPQIFRESIYFYIKYIVKKILLKNKSGNDLRFISDIKYLADLRQYYQNLYIKKKNFGELSDHDLRIIYKLSSSLLKKNFDSPEINFWEYSSWLSHIMFFVKIYNTCKFSDEIINIIHDKHYKLIIHLVNLLNDSNSEDSDEIVGAFMKISLVTPFDDLSFTSIFDKANYSKIRDILLNDSNDACVFFNKVALACLFDIKKKLTKHEYSSVLNKFISEASIFSKPEGGYSFFKNCTQNFYYGTKLKSYQNCSDLHGTAMFLWAENLLKMGLTRKSLLTDIHHVENYKI